MVSHGFKLFRTVSAVSHSLPSIPVRTVSHGFTRFRTDPTGLGWAALGWPRLPSWLAGSLAGVLAMMGLCRFPSTGKDWAVAGSEQALVG